MNDNRETEHIQMMTLSQFHFHDNINTFNNAAGCFFAFLSPSLTVIVSVEFGFELLHLPLITEQQRSVFLQRPHSVLLLVLCHLLNEGILLIVGDS